jgi:hypothetical protein
MPPHTTPFSGGLLSCFARSYSSLVVVGWALTVEWKMEYYDITINPSLWYNNLYCDSEGNLLPQSAMEITTAQDELGNEGPEKLAGILLGKTSSSWKHLSSFSKHEATLESVSPQLLVASKMQPW